MAALLDVLGSMVTGGIVILMITVLNIKIADSGQEKSMASFTQTNINTSAQIVDYYLYKIGYKVPGVKIASADSSSIKFYTDMNNDGTIDSVHIYLGAVSSMVSTKNPNDRALYLTFNKNSPVIQSVVTRFNLTYFDSAGTKISSAALSLAQRQRVRSIGVFLKMESADPNEVMETGKMIYQAAELNKIVKPKNLSY
jgi:hypothetical protein